MTYDNIKDNNFDVDVYVDFNISVIDDNFTVFVTDEDDLIIDEGYWDDDSFASESEITERESISGSYKSWKLKFSGDKVNQGIALLGLSFIDVLLDD